MNDNWYVVRVQDNGANVVMSDSDSFDKSYRDYVHFTRMNPRNYYVIVSEKNLVNYFDLVER